MKNISLKTAGLVTALFLSTGMLTATMAQQGHMRFRGGAAEMNTQPGARLKLTEDQQKQMPGLKTKFQEESTHIKNLIREKQAHIKTLVDTENRDPKELNKTIDELSALRGDLMKKTIEHRDAVKKILTPEQMKIWERMAHQRMRGMQAGMGGGMAPGMAPGMGPEMGRGMGRGMGQAPMTRSMHVTNENGVVTVESGSGNIQGKAISVEGYPINVERKEIVVEGKPMKVVEKEIVIDGKKMKDIKKKKNKKREIEEENR